MKIKAKSAVLSRLSHDLEIMDLTIPPLKDGQVLVKINYSCICHSQINEIMGNRGVDKHLPHCLGHEASGIVVETTKSVRKVKKNDSVVLTWIKGKGADISSTSYESSKGIINSGAISTFMNYAVVSENRVVKIPKSFPMLEASLLGCAIPTGAGIIFNKIDVAPSDSIIIFGCGGIGLSAVMACKAKNLKHIIAVDIHKSKLDLARDFGATHTLLYSSSLSDQLREIQNSVGFDFAIDATGNIDAIKMSIESLKDSGVFILAGNPTFDEVIPLNPYDLIKGKSITGTWGGETNPDKDILKYISYVRNGDLNLEKFLSKPYELEDINQAIADFKNGKILRPIIKMSH